MKKLNVRNMVLAALSLALCLVLPFLTGQIPEIGSALSPMHIPVLLCGFICGPWYGAAVGFIAPILRNLIFGMPPFPMNMPMACYVQTHAQKARFYICLPHRRNAGRPRGLGHRQADTGRRAEFRILLADVHGRRVHRRSARHNLPHRAHPHHRHRAGKSRTDAQKGLILT